MLMASYCFNSKRTAERSKNGNQKIQGKYGVQKKKAYVRENPEIQKKKKIF